jgi:hypothetical protein
LIEDERKAIIAEVERLALQAQIPLHLCVGSWSADHLSRIAWNTPMKKTSLIVLDDVNEFVFSFSVINTKQYNFFYRVFSRKSRITVEIVTLLLAQVKLL